MSLPENMRFADIMQLIPQAAALGLEVVSTDSASVVLRLPYDRSLVAYPESGILAGGAIFTLMDTASGGAVMMATGFGQLMATLDLRLDYLRPARPGSDVLAKAECYRLTRSAAFVRGVAYHETADDPIAHSVGTFVPRWPVQRKGKDAQAAQEGGPDDTRDL